MGFFLTSSAHAAPLPKGDRTLSIDVNMAGDNDYDKAFNLAREAGMQTTALSINWSDIETAPGTYQDPGSVLYITNTYNPPKNTKVALYIRAIDTGSKPVPSDLKNIPFTSPVMADRYLKMISWVLAQIPNVEVEFISIGDEIDLFMGENTILYSEFGTFFKTVETALDASRPNLKVGFSATLYGLTAQNASQNVADALKNINQNSDMVLVSYYPVNVNVTPKAPSVVTTDYDALVGVYPGRVIYMEQTGYATSSYLGSSEAKQAEFVRNTFLAWDKYAAQIKYISFTWLTDLSQEAVDFYKQYYDWDDPNFLEFLHTLGFRTYPGAGTNKEGFNALKAEAQARGWGTGIPPSDTISPIISLTAPITGTTVSGIAVTMSATASDNVGVSHVEFLVDGVVKANDIIFPYSFFWDTTNDGTHSCSGVHTHTLTAKAYDVVGNMTTSAGVTVNMNNPGYCVTYTNANFVQLVTQWLHTTTSPAPFSSADINTDRIVDIRDLGIMMNRWQTSP